MKLNRTLVMCLTIALAATIAIGGSMAYLTSTDGQRNTMTVGNVKIEQIEQQRTLDDNGEIVSSELEAFKQDKPLLPAYYPDLEYSDVAFGDDVYKAFGSEVDGLVDKVVTVKNTGSEPAYVRTIMAFEHTDPNGDGNFADGLANKLHAAFNGKDWDFATFADTRLDNLEFGRKFWSLAVFTYKTELAAETVSAPSLLQLFFDKTVTTEDLEALGLDRKYDILVLSQAVQTQMGDLKLGAALDEAFGKIEDSDESIAKLISWLEPLMETPAVEPDVDEGASED